ncbi:sensor domain-containing protein [Streptomyces mirabilis]|uniref:sensor domain-containing protein n=1 Tax=Streptomyces mirabilis TaxID=68239 RepID=UPI003F4C3BB1
MLLITATLTLAVVGAGLLPETVLLIRRIAGAKRNLVAQWTGKVIPEAYQPIEGPLRQRLRTAVRGPGTLGDFRWMICHYVYGFLGLLTVPLWLLGLPVDGVRQGLLGRSPLVLPLIGRLADLDAAWSTALLEPSPEALLAVRIEELTETRAGAIAAHGAELRRIERDLHDGTQARLVSLSMRIGIAKRAYERDPETALKLLEDAQSQAEADRAAPRRPRHPPADPHRPGTGRRRTGARREQRAGRHRRRGRLGGRGAERVPGPGGGRGGGVLRGRRIADERRQAQRIRARRGAAGAQPGRPERPGRRRGTGRSRGPSQALGSGGEAGGSGLLGMQRRVAALDGTLLMTSPVGGPTVIEVELPCVW